MPCDIKSRAIWRCQTCVFGDTVWSSGVHHFAGSYGHVWIAGCRSWHLMLLQTPPAKDWHTHTVKHYGILVVASELQIVNETLQAMRVLLDRLSALQMMLQQKPVVSGHYTAAPYVSCEMLGLNATLHRGHLIIACCLAHLYSLAEWLMQYSLYVIAIKQTSNRILQCINSVQHQVWSVYGVIGFVCCKCH